jgi:hypothetical protein
MKKTFIILALNLIFLTARAQNKGFFDLQLDPTPFFLKGYAAELGYNYAKHRFYVTGVGYTVPDFLKEDRNFDEKRKLVAGLGYQYYFKKPQKGLFVGMSVLNSWTDFTNPSTGNGVSFTTARTSGRIGYVFYPIKQWERFFFNTWVGPYYQIAPDSPIVDGLQLKRKNLSYTLAIQIGFNLNKK